MFPRCVKTDAPHTKLPTLESSLLMEHVDRFAYEDVMFEGRTVTIYFVRCVSSLHHKNHLGRSAVTAVPISLRCFFFFFGGFPHCVEEGPDPE